MRELTLNEIEEVNGGDVQNFATTVTLSGAAGTVGYGLGAGTWAGAAASGGPAGLFVGAVGYGAYWLGQNTSAGDPGRAFGAWLYDTFS